MNKKYLIYNVLAVFLMTSTPSFSMNGSFFRLARVAGATAVPCIALLLTINEKEQLKKSVNRNNRSIRTVLRPKEAILVEEWFLEKKEQVNTPNLETVLLVFGPEWGSIRNNTQGRVLVSSADLTELSAALVAKLENEKMTDWSAHQNNMTLAKHSMILGHELGHIANNDDLNRLYARASIPVGVELALFGITSKFKELCRISPPKKFIETVLRSSLAVGAIGPKLLISLSLFWTYCRYRETQADRFSCENAKSRLELEVFADIFRKYSVAEGTRKPGVLAWLIHMLSDAEHPYSADRVKIVEGYLTQWDVKHADNSSVAETIRS